MFYGKEDTSYSQQLLNLEKQILLHPRNIQHLLMPLTNDIFVEDLYKKEFVAKGYISKDTDNYFSILDPITNVKKAIIFVKGKFAVGIGAKSITFHSLAQRVQGPSIESEFVVGQSAKGPITMSTRLRFEGLNNGGRYFGNYTDTSGNLISEIMSQLLTMYVDGVKEPYAVLMNITMQTANVVDYLIKAGLSAKQITFFLSQPLIKEYLLTQKVNESLFNKNGKRLDDRGRSISAELSKDELIQKVLGNRYNVGKEKPYVGFINLPVDWQITNLESSISGKDFKEQMYMLQHYLEIVEMAKAYGRFLQTQDSDTRGFADSQDILLDNQMRTQVETDQIVNPDTIEEYDHNSVIAPFYQYGRRSYFNLYHNFYTHTLQGYFSESIQFMKEKLVAQEKGENKDRLLSTIDNDFMLFLAHNFFFNQDDFDRLLKGDQSVAKRLKKLKTQVPSNLFLKNIQILIGNQTDPLTKEKIDNIRLVEKKLESISANDITNALEEIAELDGDLYRDIVHLLYFQNGYNQGIYNYFNVVPVGLESQRSEDTWYRYLTQDIIKQVNDQVKNFTYEESMELFKAFTLLFDLNNPHFVKKQTKGHQVYKTYDSKTNTVKLMKRLPSGNSVEIPILGNKTMKRYNFEFKPELESGQSEEQTKEAFRNTDLDAQNGIDQTLVLQSKLKPKFFNLTNDQLIKLREELKNSKNNYVIAGEKIFSGSWLRSEIEEFDLEFQFFSTSKNGKIIYTEYIPVINFLFTDNGKKYKGTFSTLLNTQYKGDTSLTETYMLILKDFYTINYNNDTDLNAQDGIDQTLNDC